VRALTAFGGGVYPGLKPLARRKIPADIRSLARSYTDETVRRLAAIMRDPGKDEPVMASVAAGKILLDRGWGLPAQPHTGEDGEGDIRITVRHITEGKK
jgi:hypothetical protein